MKKYFKIFIIFMIMCLGFVTSSYSQEIQCYKAQNFAIASVYNGCYTWSDWERSNINITFDLSNDIITIYSSKTQIYKVYSTSDAYTDSDGGTQVKFYVIDQDYDRGTVRLRIQRDGSSQIYVDFSDVAWCYGNVVRTR